MTGLCIRLITAQVIHASSGSYVNAEATMSLVNGIYFLNYAHAVWRAVADGRDAIRGGTFFCEISGN